MSDIPQRTIDFMSQYFNLDHPIEEFCAKMELELIKAEKERDEAREQAQQMSESNQVLMADVRFYRNAWEQLKEGAK